MNHWICRIAVAGLMLGAAAGVVACSDDDGDELTLEQYFAAVDTIDNDTSARVDGAFETITDEEDVAQFRNAYEELPAALEDAASDLDALDPPEEAKDAHDATVAALNNLADAAQESADEASDATTVDEFFSTVEAGGFAEADEAFTAACLDLQQVAADNSITVDLGCDDEEGDASAAAEQAVQDVVAAWNASDVEAFAALFTDAGLNSAFGDGEEAAPRAEIVAFLPEVVGDGAVVVREISSESTDTGADVTVLWVSGKVLENYRFSLVDDAGIWKVDAQEVLELEPPTGATIVNVDLNEFAFGLDESQITSTSPIVLQGNNVGAQLHHMVFVKIPVDAVLEELLASEGDPPGVEEFGGGEPFPPGESQTIAFADPLEPGRYLLVCFLPDTEDPAETPHALKGMVADITVQ